MSPHYKAFIVVFVISVLTLIFFQRPFAESVGAKRFRNWRNLWLALVISAFFVTNYWVFVVVSGLVVFVMSRAEPVKPAIYLLLLAAAPPMGGALSGFGGINYFMKISPQLVIAAVVLIPALFASKHMKKIARAGNAADVFFLLWLALQFVLAVRAPSFTSILRTIVEEFLAAAPLYYVFSRYPKKLDDIRVLSAAFVLPVLILSATTIPEFLRNWHFYNSVATNWFGQLPFAYTLREGFLRTSASVFNPITWGFVGMSATGIGLAVLNDRVSKFYKYAGFALLAAGLITSLSRGPWIGAAVIVVVFALSGVNFTKRFFQLAGGGLVAGLATMATPFGKRILDLLPFIGDASTDTVSYRQQLLDAAWDVMLQTPFFGSPNYLENSMLQSLRQGQGIIDIVNTYLQVGLKSGLVGLTLFVGVFVSALLALRKAMKSARAYDARLALYCQAYFATIIGIMVAIFTTSNVGQIPLVYWSLTGGAIALARIEEVQRAKSDAPAAQEKNAAPAQAFAWK